MVVDRRDAALQAICPCTPVPKFGDLGSAGAGQRVLVAADGVFLEVTRPWLRCVLRLAGIPSTPPLPYGSMKESIRFTFGVIPIDLLEAFAEHGRRHLPNEVAGALVHDALSNTLRLVIHESITAGPGGVAYRMPNLAPSESIAVDLHTHGRYRACWSTTDDADDQGVKVCGVFGSLHRGRPTAAFRLAVNGAFRALAHPWQESAEPEAAPLDAEGLCPTLDAMGFETFGLWNT
jgi:PRTRC genetic system protein A